VLITDVAVAGHGRTNVLLREGRIAGFPREIVPGERVLAGRGCRLLPGLVDEHLHLLAAAAVERSIDACELDDESLRALVEARAAEGPVRVTGYGGGEHALLDRDALDVLCPGSPMRLQYRSGRLWVLNSAALDALQPSVLRASAFERSGDGRLTGRVWRGDSLLRREMPEPNALDTLGLRLARWGVTSVTDASVSTDDTQAAVLAPLLARMPQRMQLMGSEALSASTDASWSCGPRKILLDESDLPRFEDLCAQITASHLRGRNVAVHCVTSAELAFTVAALQASGPMPGDRIEHGALISAEMIPVLAEMGLVVVTQPGFVYQHGDRYLRSVGVDQQDDLYRVSSLVRAGVAVAFSSDAPYGPLNPWVNLRSAILRRSRAGAPLAAHEMLPPEQALARYAGCSMARLGTATLQVGMAADLCLLRHDVDWIQSDDPVACTLVGGRPIYLRDTHGSGDGLTDDAAALRERRETMVL